MFRLRRTAAETAANKWQREEGVEEKKTQSRVAEKKMGSAQSRKRKKEKRRVNPKTKEMSLSKAGLTH